MLGGRRGAPLLALVPWGAFLVTLPVADLFVHHRSVSAGGLAASAPWYLGFVALPSVLPIAAAGRRAVRWAAVSVMTITAVVAGAAVIGTDDAQAGLNVLLVAYVALPLAVVVVVGEAITRRVGHTG